MSPPLRIANASAFWGDQPEAAARLVGADRELDYLTFDYLAEVSLSIMAGVREKDPTAGYARDFVEVIRSLLPFYHSGGKTRIVTNAGGLNVSACAAAVAAELRNANLAHLRLAVVTGDDVLTIVAHDQGGYRNLETDAPLSSIADRLVTANAYL